jgi:hypothetical protein
LNCKQTFYQILNLLYKRKHGIIWGQLTLAQREVPTRQGPDRLALHEVDQSVYHRPANKKVNK